MSWLSKLNPLNWLDGVKSALQAKYIGSTIRTLLAAAAGGVALLGAYLKAHGVDDTAVAAFSTALQHLLDASAPVLSGLATVFVTWAFSILDKKKNQE